MINDRNKGWEREEQAGGGGGRCYAVFGGLTSAQKAQKYLDSAAIPSTLVKMSDKWGGRGCVYTLEYPCSQSGNVRATLEGAGIRPKEWGE